MDELSFPNKLEGQRAVLLPLTREHAEELYECGSANEIWTYLPNKMESKDDMYSFIHEANERKKSGLEYPFAVYDNHLNKWVGSTRFLNVSHENKGLEIGYTWYSPEVWRTRINTECKYLLLQHCFEQMGFIRVQLKADVRNERSNRAIQRIGAIKEGELRQDRILPDGYMRNSYLYSIIHSEWPDVKSRLEAYLSR